MTLTSSKFWQQLLAKFFTPIPELNHQEALELLYKNQNLEFDIMIEKCEKIQDERRKEYWDTYFAEIERCKANRKRNERINLRSRMKRY